MMYRFLGMLLTAAILAGAWAPSASAVSTSAVRVLLYINGKEAFVNGKSVMLDSPATVVNGKTYVPVKFLGDAFGFPVTFDQASKSITVKAGDTDVFINLKTNSVLVGGMPQSFDPIFKMINNRLMAQLTWMMDRAGANYTYSPELKRIEVNYLPKAGGIIGADGNSRPIAKFTFGKSSYKMGEKIKYIDLSYDVDGDGIAYVSWKNKQEAFFTPGKHQVSLQVKDTKGNVSDWYTREITIENTQLYAPGQFQLHYAPEQTYIKMDRSMIGSYFGSLSPLPITMSERPGRKLLVSDSPENITELGILYEDTVNGRGRLYANHVNSTNERLQFAILATNQGSEPVTIKTTRKGEVYPSIYANLLGHQATLDFLLNDGGKPDVHVPGGQTVAYALLPEFTQGQGINLIYDVETSGEVTFSFVAMVPNDPLSSLKTYPKLPYNGHVRGSFPVSELYWDVNAYGQGGTITIGDNIRDKFVTGYDVFRQESVMNKGNYGVTYQIRVNRPGKAALLLVARGGPFKGPFKIDGEMMLAPPSGIITAYDGVFLITRTDGTEPFVDIEFSPPAGSAFPIDLILYPLD
ncbi:copper amine oxidase N-terminal domain-containing protein [Paenibacillus thermotolerans]|uniref:copper amine oxidase N-terminal domain-containing protein n=1 Tax=Paenibacillus thermotolerans TaxID=3027807 RepID=UPI00236749E7|nr:MULTISPECIES: copper amine oxidase N-terminal domain-containing protein [unclassified Paenibacillus]